MEKPVESNIIKLGYDPYELQRDLDRTKSAVFMGTSAAFFGSLMCSLNFIWSESIRTAATDSVHLWWAPSYFNKLPTDSRKTELMHELWHCGLLHPLRLGNRDPRIWNIACDIKIDLDLLADGYSFEGIEGVLSWPWLDAKQYAGMVEEDIYDDLIAKHQSQIPTFYEPSLFPLDPTEALQIQQNLLLNVVSAIHESKLAGESSGIPGDVIQWVEKFLQPVVPWEIYLQRFMLELTGKKRSYRQPNRRYQHLCLPGRIKERSGLAHVVFCEDVSGSMLDEDVVRVNSEVKYIFDTFQPEKLTLLQFDTQIQQTLEFKQGDSFDRVKIMGRGGTNLACVQEWIIKNKPTAIIIFSDLECAPMSSLPFDVPTIWVCVRNRKARVPFGQLIHIH